MVLSTSSNYGLQMDPIILGGCSNVHWFEIAYLQTVPAASG